MRQLLFIISTFTFWLPSNAQVKTIVQDVLFETEDPQSMWGVTNFQINRRAELGESFRVDEGFNTGNSLIVNIEGYRFGASIAAEAMVDIGPVVFEISGFNLGEVDVKYPMSVELTVPEDLTFNKGEEINISTDYSIKDDYALNTNYPESGRIGLDLPMQADFGLEIQACMARCTDLTIVSLDEPPILDTFTVLSATRDSYDILCLRGAGFGQACDEPMPGSGGVEITGNARNPLSGFFDLPFVETDDGIDGKSLVASGQDTYINLSLDIVGLLRRVPKFGIFAEILEGDQDIVCVPDITGANRCVNVFWTFLAMSLDIPISHTQEFSFTPEIDLELGFIEDVDYVVNERNGQSSGGRSSIVRLPLGSNARIQYPCNYDFMDIDANYLMYDNTFTNKTYDELRLDLNFSSLRFGVSIPDYVLFPELCVLGVCTPEIKFDGRTYDYPSGGGYLVGPITQNIFTVDFPAYFDSSWELDGFSSSFPVEEPFQLRPRPREMQLALAEEALCAHDSTGKADVEITGVTPPLSYEWSNGSRNERLENGHVGRHYVIVEDANGCREHGHVIIPGPDPIDINSEKSDALCYGSPTGAIDLSVSGGRPPYHYIWDDVPDFSAPERDEMTAGSYKVTVTDTNDCTVETSITIDEPQELDVALSNIEEPACHGFSDGKVFLQVGGGTEPYAYQWSSGARQKDLFNIPSGNYNVDVTDTNGCTTSLFVPVGQPSPLEVPLTVDKAVSCYGGADGEISTNIDGGTPPYNIEWLNGNVKLSSKSPTIRRLDAGVYVLQVKDQNNCFATNSTTLEGPEEAIRVAIEEKHVTCYDGEDGEAIAEAAGGTPPYRATWTGGQTGMRASGLRAGEKIVTIRDANGCEQKQAVVLVQGEPVILDLEATDVSCANQQDGKVTAHVMGGEEPLNYTWSNGENQSQIDGLADGYYEVTVADARGCEASDGEMVLLNDQDCLHIPNAFSPNDDGINDTWVIRNIALYPGSSVVVLNRWGEKVYEAAPYLEPWDGTRNGVLLPPATYYFILELGNGEEEISGPLSIVK